jgi:ribosomal protein S7
MSASFDTIKQTTVHKILNYIFDTIKQTTVHKVLNFIFYTIKQTTVHKILNCIFDTIKQTTVHKVLLIAFSPQASNNHVHTDRNAVRMVRTMIWAHHGKHSLV